MTQPRILLVEDNLINLELFTDLLEANDFTVLAAKDPDTAMEIARREMPDLILMDVALPGVDGLEATRRLKEDVATSSIPIVALTAHAMKGDEERAYAAGCTGYISKPINTRAFPRLVRELCESAARAVLTPNFAVAPAAGGVPHATPPADVREEPLPEAIPVPDEPGEPEALQTVPVETPQGITTVVAQGDAVPAVEARPEPRRSVAAPAVRSPENPPRILIVDDDPMNREILAEIIAVFGYASIEAENGPDALSKIGDHIDLVLMDLMMPDMDGCEAITILREELGYADIPVVMVTALSNREDRLRAIEAGANDFITKPVDRTELRVRLASLLKLKTAQDRIKQHQLDLESTIKTKTGDLRKAIQQITLTQQQAQEAQWDTLNRLALTAERRWNSAATLHVRCICEYCAVIARSLEMSNHAVETVLHAAAVHDVGLLELPDTLFGKSPRDYTPDEEATYRQHTTYGAQILSGSASELLRAGEVIAASHHERWDGTGFPRGLRGEDIPLFARICAVADTFDSLTAYQPDTEILLPEDALARMAEEVGQAWDARVFTAFTSAFDDIVRIYGRFRRGQPPPGLHRDGDSA